MRAMNTILGLLSVLLFIQCWDDENTLLPPEPCIYDCDTSKLHIVWQMPLGEDSGDYAALGPIVFENNVLFTKKFGVGFEPVVFRDGNTGQTIWRWEKTPSISTLLSSENSLMVCDWHHIYMIDLNEGKEIWNTNVGDSGGCGYPRAKIIGDYIYHTHENCGLYTTEGNLVRSHIKGGGWDTIYSRKNQGGYEPSLEMPSLWINPEGDSILVFQNRSKRQFDGRIDLIVFNLTQDTTVYEIPDFEIDGNSSVEPPLIWEEKIYFMGNWTLYCLDIHTGNILWQKRFGSNGDDHLLVSNLLIAENKLIVNPSSEYLFALDPFTGTEIWKKNDGSTNCSDMVYHDGIIYFASFGKGKLYATEAATGKNIWAEESPNKKKGFPNAVFGRGGGVALNPELGYLYASDGNFAMCIKLPER